MLPAHRVIGHKEWAPGRKSDPTYSMDWRRSRVAAFTPRTSSEGDFMALSEAEQQELLQGVRQLTRITASQESDTPRMEADVVTFSRKADAYTHRLLAEEVPAVRQELAGLRAAVDKLATAATGGDEVTADELRAVVREEMAKVVRVQVTVDDGGA